MKSCGSGGWPKCLNYAGALCNSPCAAFEVQEYRCGKACSSGSYLTYVLQGSMYHVFSSCWSPLGGVLSVAPQPYWEGCVNPKVCLESATPPGVPRTFMVEEGSMWSRRVQCLRFERARASRCLVQGILSIRGPPVANNTAASFLDGLRGTLRVSFFFPPMQGWLARA